MYEAAVLLSVLTGVMCCGLSSTFNMCKISIAKLKLLQKTPVLVSAANEITGFNVLYSTYIGKFYVGVVVELSVEIRELLLG